jgi:uncharacterized membrane protein YbhN (UPF0104 family)
MAFTIKPEHKERVRALVPWITAGVLLLAVASAWRMLRQVGRAELGRALSSTDAHDLLAAAVFSAGSYLTLTFFDWMAVRTVARSSLAYPKIALTSFIAPLDRAHGRLRGPQHRDAALPHLLPLRPERRRRRAHRRLLGHHRGGGPRGAARASRACCVRERGRVRRRPALGRVLARRRRARDGADLRRPLGGGSPAARAGGWRRNLPTARVACLQVAVGALNYLFVAATLHRLLGDAADVSLFSFASYYVVGNALGILSHVPGASACSRWSCWRPSRARRPWAL